MKVRKISSGASYSPNSLNVLIIAGVHGNELTAMNVCNDLYNHFSKCHNSLILNANLTVLNYVNEYGLKKCVREWASVENNNDLNRYHYCEDDVVKNEREYLKKVILQNDIVIDIHSSPNISEFFLIDNNSCINLEYFKENGIPYVVRDFDGKTIKSFCLGSFNTNQKKILGFTFETNGMKEVNFESSKRSFNILRKVIEDIDNLYKANINAEALKLNFDELLQPCFSLCTGFIKSKYKTNKLGLFFYKDEKIVEIVDYKDENRIFEIKSPTNGILVELIDKDFVNYGDVVCSVQPIE